MDLGRVMIEEEEIKLYPQVRKRLENEGILHRFKWYDSIKYWYILSKDKMEWSLYYLENDKYFHFKLVGNYPPELLPTYKL